jgi:hypothetical protein
MVEMRFTTRATDSGNGVGRSSSFFGKPNAGRERIRFPDDGYSAGRHRSRPVRRRNVTPPRTAARADIDRRPIPEWKAGTDGSDRLDLPRTDFASTVHNLPLAQFGLPPWL